MTTIVRNTEFLLVDTITTVRRPKLTFPNGTDTVLADMAESKIVTSRRTRPFKVTLKGAPIIAFVLTGAIGDKFMVEDLLHSHKAEISDIIKLVRSLDKLTVSAYYIFVNAKGESFEVSVDGRVLYGTNEFKLITQPEIYGIGQGMNFLIENASDILTPFEAMALVRNYKGDEIGFKYDLLTYSTAKLERVEVTKQQQKELFNSAKKKLNFNYRKWD